MRHRRSAYLAVAALEVLEDRILLTPRLQVGSPSTFGGNPLNQGYVINSSPVTDLEGNVYFASLSGPLGGYGFNSNYGNRGDLHIAKYATDGTLKWSTIFFDDPNPAAGIYLNSNASNSVAIGRDGSVFIVGFCLGTTQLGNKTLTSDANEPRAFIAQLDSSGHLLNVIQPAGAGGNDITGVTCDENGNLYLTGVFHGSMSFGSTTLNSTTDDSGALRDNIFVAKLDGDNFTCLNAVSMAVGAETVSGIGLDGFGNIYIAGSFWSQFSSVYFGSTQLFSLGYDDMFVAKLDGELNVLKAVAMGGDYIDEATGIAVNDFGDVFISAWCFSSQDNFGSVVVDRPTPYSEYSVVAKLNSNLTVVNAVVLGSRPNSKQQGTVAGGLLLLSSSFTDRARSRGPLSVKDEDSRREAFERSR